MGTNEIVGRETAASRNIFDFFGYAITTVTWISFCVVTIFVIKKYAGAGVEMHLKGAPARYFYGAILFAVVLGFLTSMMLLLNLIGIVGSIFSVYGKSENRFVGWVVRNTENYLVLGSLALVVIISGALSFQALVSLDLL